MWALFWMCSFASDCSKAFNVKEQLFLIHLKHDVDFTKTSIAWSSAWTSGLFHSHVYFRLFEKLYTPLHRPEAHHWRERWFLQVLLWKMEPQQKRPQCLKDINMFQQVIVWLYKSSLPLSPFYCSFCAFSLPFLCSVSEKKSSFNFDIVLQKWYGKKGFQGSTCSCKLIGDFLPLLLLPPEFSSRAVTLASKFASASSKSVSNLCLCFCIQLTSNCIAFVKLFIESYRWMDIKTKKFFNYLQFFPGWWLFLSPVDQLSLQAEKLWFQVLWCWHCPHHFLPG